MDRPASESDSRATPPWSGQAAAESLQRFLEKGQIEPARALLLSAGMVEEAAELLRSGFPVIAVDKDDLALKQLGRSLREGNGTASPVRADFLAMPPSLCGSVELVVDRLYVHQLAPSARADWVHKVGRVLPRGGRLVGLFLIGRSPDGPPHAMTLEALKKLTGRLFTTEVLESSGPSAPGRPQAYRGLFLRK